MVASKLEILFSPLVYKITTRFQRLNTAVCEVKQSIETNGNTLRPNPKFKSQDGDHIPEMCISLFPEPTGTRFLRLHLCVRGPVIQRN